MSKKKGVAIQVSEGTYKVLRELQVLTGEENDEEFLRRLLERYVQYEYGIEDLDRYTLADFMRFLQFLSRFVGMLQHLFAVMQPNVMPPPMKQVEESEEAKEISKQEEMYKSLEESISRLASTVEELRSEIMALKSPNNNQQEELVDIPDEVMEMRREINKVMMTYMMNLMKQIQAQLLLSMPIVKTDVQKAKSE